MTSAQDTRPTARQTVRDHAAEHGWTLKLDIDIMDVFERDQTMVCMGWSLVDNQRVAFGSWLQVGDELAGTDISMMSIVKCREWLAQERDADATV